jgi:tRNA threonylcarbamoyl adenosine modification protein YeaZ
MMRLILDRSGQHSGFALVRENKILCERSWEDGCRCTPGWFAEMTADVETLGVRNAEINQFVCIMGPGSFTGIRSAMAALEGMALPGGCPVYGISSSALIAFEYGTQENSDCTVIGDARRSTLWLSSFKLSASAGLTLLDGTQPTQSASDFRLVPANELQEAVPNDTLIVSPDFDRLASLLEQEFSPDRLIKSKVSSRATVAAALTARFPALLRQEPLPIYLHPPVATAAG